jgi:erythromycin esterase-like protein
MSVAAPNYATLDEWIAAESIHISLDAFPRDFDRAVAALGASVELLGFGEPLHGAPEPLILRNRIFARLVEAHGYSAIAVESSFPRGRFVDEYITGGASGAAYETIQQKGFSHGFGKLDANREFVEWMRRYNADPAHPTKLRFYGFDSPTEMTGTDSPRQCLQFALDYLAAMDSASGAARRKRIDALIGSDADWENPAAMMDPGKSIGLSPAATELRMETEELLNELNVRRPELIEKSDAARFQEAAQHVAQARHLLNYHAALARPSDRRIADLLGIRDLMMAENLVYACNRERGRGKVFAFAHNSHLKLGQAKWQLGPHALAWWPAGAHLKHLLGSRYAVIGAGIGAAAAQGIAAAEAGTLEGRLSCTVEGTQFVATRGVRRLASCAISELPTRSGSSSNSSYFPFTPDSLTDFDALLVMNLPN